MATFESALDDCLKRIEAGEADVDTCLKLYPEYTEQLRPLLETAARMKPGSEPKQTSAPSKSAPAAAPSTQIHKFADSKGPRRRSLGWYAPPAVRVAALVFLILMGLFLVGTVYAQTAYPGDFLYGWKRASENVVRVINPVLVDLYLSQRRANEVLAVRNDPAQLAIAWAGYREVMNRLLAYNDPIRAAHIAAVLRAQWDAFVQAGVPLPTGAAALPPVPTPSPTPTPTESVLGTPASTFPPLKDTATPAAGTSAPTSTRAGFPTVNPIPTRTPRPTRTSFATWTPGPSRTPFNTPTSLPTLPPPPTFSFPTP